MQKLSCLFLFLFVGFWACRPAEERITTSPEKPLRLSQDTIAFDTIFTTLRSTTQAFQIYNPNKEAVLINAFVKGGENSPFKMIVNGKKAPFIQDIRLLGNDSILVLIEATIDANQQNNPLLIEDEAIFTAQGSQPVRAVLQAYGQDATIIRSHVIDCNTVWDAKKPYIIMSSQDIFVAEENNGVQIRGAGVLVPEGCTLTIKKGTRLHFAFGTGIFVKGTLNIEGELNEVATLTSLRYDGNYKTSPGQWTGIYLAAGSKANIDYAVIENCGNFVSANLLNLATKTQINLSNSVLRQAIGEGLLLNQSEAFVYNCLLYDSPIWLVARNGGDYKIWHNTFGLTNRFGFKREVSGFILSDNLVENNAIVASNSLKADVISNVIYGNQNDEWLLSLSRTDNNLFVKRNVIRNTRYQDIFGAENRFVNATNLFKDITKSDFELDSSSVAVNYGWDTLVNAVVPIQAQRLKKDLKGKNRSLTTPDAGCFERD
jgi:hypothetical protein